MINAHMKILVVGLGSMGKRRIRILKALYDHEIFGVDTRKDRLEEVEMEYGIKTFNHLEKAFSIIQPEAVFVCTSPLTHSEIVIYSLKNNAHTFSELNLKKDSYNDIIELSKSKNKIAFLSSTMLYRKEIRYILNRLNNKQNLSYRYHIGQYLPDWHPWENYSDFFVANKETNGCRELMAIELPWITKAFGKVDELHVLSTKYSKLNLDYNDTYHILLKHSSGCIGTLNIDVISRKATRSLEIYSEELHLTWDGTPSSLKEYDIASKNTYQIDLYEDIIRNEKYSDNIIENAYADEIDLFFESLGGTDKNAIYRYEDDIYILNLIDEIEKGH